MTKDELIEFRKLYANKNGDYGTPDALERVVDKLNERIEELEQAIRSFTSEEGEDLAEVLYQEIDQDMLSDEWRTAIALHRSEIEKLRALVPPHRVG